MVVVPTNYSSPGSKPAKRPFAFRTRTKLAQWIMELSASLALKIAPWVAGPAHEEDEER